MSRTSAVPPPSRLRTAALAPIGDEGRTELVESRVVQAISTGAFIEGERLPSESELASLLRVAVVTVRDALGALRERGLIETRRGRNGGSFVRTSRGAVERVNAQSLMGMSRVVLADLGVAYEVVSGACADYACVRATASELAIIDELLHECRDLERHLWRRRITEVQLELAALSQSVRLTREHVRLQTEFTPFLALQDLDVAARTATHDALESQIRAMIAGDVPAARAAVRESVQGSVRWLVAFRTDLIAHPGTDGMQATLESRQDGRKLLEEEVRSDGDE